LTPAEVSEFPARYEPLQRLGKGGGGEVWSARDRVTGSVVALKLLRVGADDLEVMALVREATALSGIEGLGVPRVLHFGRLPVSGRVYLVRELVEGASLADLLGRHADPRTCLAAVAESANLLTRLHRSLLLHGDVKPANIIVGSNGRATLVDLGLAAQWHEGGAAAEGLTPRYAAPELFRGEPLTPQAEVFALGATLAEVLDAVGANLPDKQREAVQAIVKRATLPSAADRYPSADEFAEALKSAAHVDSAAGDRPVSSRTRGAHEPRLWPFVGIDRVASDLLARITGLDPGGGILVTGPAGSGRSTLLLRMSWSLGVAGRAVAFIDEGAIGDLDAAIDAALDRQLPSQVVLIVDDADRLDPRDFERIDRLRSEGARLVAAVGNDAEPTRLPGQRTFALFAIPPLDPRQAADAALRMIPSLSDAMARHLVARAGGYPGPLRAMVERLEGAAMVSIDDLDRALDEAPVPVGVRIDPAEIHLLLDRGRFDAAADYLAAYGSEATLSIALARAKLATGRGDPKLALLALKQAEPLLGDAPEEDHASWHVQKARAHLRAGDYEAADEHSLRALDRLGMRVGEEGETLSPDSRAAALVADALAVAGLTQSLSGKHDLAAKRLAQSVDVARRTGDPRVLAIALGSLAFALQRNDRLDEAVAAHREALALAEQAGDAGHIATTRLNLATIAHSRGDFGAALAHLEAAVDMGRRSGRMSTVRQALFNLASLDLYLGRQARADASIEALLAERDSLSATARAQLLALQAESASLAGDVAVAAQKCRECAEAYQSLGRAVDAAEALLERVLVSLRAAAPDLASLQEELLTAEAMLADSGAHQPLLCLARGSLALHTDELELARVSLDAGIAAAEHGRQRDWMWRAHVARAELHRKREDRVQEEADRRRALALVEEIASPLPRDLREVYWNDPRRRPLRPQLVLSTPPLSTPPQPKRPSSLLPPNVTRSAVSEVDAPTQFAVVTREDRIARLLEINREIAGEYDLDRLLERVTDHAIALLSAERGFVLLRSRSGEDRLSIHAARDRAGNDPHGRFSRSIAERVVESGEPFLAADALRDERMSDYVSVHQLMLRSVACAPIHNRSGESIGALYLETRMRPGNMFALELPTLVALADQAAIAIETARLVNENRQRAQELEVANHELAGARDKLAELLGRRTEQLVETRRSLRDARAALRGHFGYRGIVGTSAAMRRVYAVIDRVKDADVPVLITGESGTGKEVIARTIHGSGPRAKQKFVGVNCGAIPEHLLESELFGHVRGAFTGADRDKKGLFRELDGGSILLDEIGEMPQKMQAGLLRVLQEKVVRPVGGTSEEKVDARVIAATHRNLADMVARGAFREDLLYRLNVIEIRMPSLRDRAEDIPLLVDHFLRIFAARYDRDRRTVSRDAIKRLMAYHWPGNVRQLENVLLNAWILSDHEELSSEDFELPDASGRTPDAGARFGEHDGDRPVAPPARESATERRPVAETFDDYSELEKEQILGALGSCNWNRAKAARIMGMPRRTFYRRLKKYGIQ
jgi:transcriptional regulator with GAF, ATPase, and Fis domain/tetratricopeptide (TPR) repeat protein